MTANSSITERDDQETVGTGRESLSDSSAVEAFVPSRNLRTVRLVYRTALRQQQQQQASASISSSGGADPTWEQPGLELDSVFERAHTLTPHPHLAHDAPLVLEPGLESFAWPMTVSEFRARVIEAC